MKAKQAAIVLNPYEWLPPYGETGVDVETDGLLFNVIVSYDGTNGLLRRKIKFKNCCSFNIEAFPGVSTFGFQEKDDGLLFKGALVEYIVSDPAKKWTNHYSGMWNIRHFRILFLSANYSITVFASDFFLEEPIFG